MEDPSYEERVDAERVRRMVATANDPFIRAGARLYRLSERLAGIDDPDDPRLETVDRSRWPRPRPSRMLDRVGDLLHDIGTRHVWKRGH